MTISYEPAVDDAPVKEPKTKGRKRKQAEPEQPQPEQPQEAQPDWLVTDAVPMAEETPTEPAPTPEPAPAKTRAKRGKKAASGESAKMTLAELSERYIKHLEAEDKSQGTMFSYAMELKTACKVLGADTLIASLTTEQVRAYFESDAVMKLRNGRDKALPSYAKTRRVLRLALVYAAERGWLSSAPIPEMEGAK